MTITCRIRKRRTNPKSGPPDIDLNIFKRYQKWAGIRSIIFQLLFVGWTAFAFLGTCGMMIPFLGQSGENEDAAMTGSMMFSCCGCGGYLIIAIPLAFAAIATLEGAVKIKGLGSKGD